MNEDKLLVSLARAHAGFFWLSSVRLVVVLQNKCCCVGGVCYCYYYCGTHNTTVAALNHYHLPTHGTVKHDLASILRDRIGFA